MMRSAGGDGEHLLVTINALGLGLGNDAFVALCDSYKAAAAEGARPGGVSAQQASASA